MPNPEIKARYLNAAQLLESRFEQIDHIAKHGPWSDRDVQMMNACVNFTSAYLAYRRMELEELGQQWEEPNEPK